MLPTRNEMFLGLAVADLPQPGLSRARGLSFPTFPILSGPGLYSQLMSLLLNYRCASRALGPGSARSSTSAFGQTQSQRMCSVSQTLGCCRRIMPIPLNHPVGRWGSVCTDLPLSALFPALSFPGKSKKIVCLFPDFILQGCPWCPATV